MATQHSPLLWLVEEWALTLFRKTFLCYWSEEVKSEFEKFILLATENCTKEIFYFTYVVYSMQKIKKRGRGKLLEIGPRASDILNVCCTTEMHPSSLRKMINVNFIPQQNYLDTENVRVLSCLHTFINLLFSW